MQKLLRLLPCFLAIGYWPLSLLSQTAPRLLPFQGRLTDQNGVAVSNGVRLVQFKVFEVPSGGSPVWAGELHRTTVNGGLVNVLLGSKTPFTGVDFDRQLYLETTVDINGDSTITAADPPMLPRQAILPVIFAKEAADSRKLAGYDWSDVLDSTNATAGRLNGTRISDGSISKSKLAPVQYGSNVNIGGFALSAAASFHQTLDTNPVAITNLSVRIRTSGRPALLGLRAQDGAVVPSEANIDVRGRAVIRFKVNGQAVADYAFGYGVVSAVDAIFYPPSAFSHIYVPQAQDGNDLTIGVDVFGNVGFSEVRILNVVLYAFEL